MAELHPTPQHTFLVEHLDPELEAWQALEYQTIYRECRASGHSRFLLSGLSDPAAAQKLLDIPPTSVSGQSVEQLYPTPEARSRVCLLDPKGEKDLSPADAEEFDVFLFGGILGDDPPRDRTGDLRAQGFPGRRLGPEQMTTDTAARVTRLVVQERRCLEDIAFVNRPEIDLTLPPEEGGKGAYPSESVEMPFKYVRGVDGKPVMPEGMISLLREDMDKGLEGLL